MYEQNREKASSFLKKKDRKLFNPLAQAFSPILLSPMHTSFFYITISNKFVMQTTT